MTDTLNGTGAVSCAACVPGRYSTVSTAACIHCAAGSVTDTLFLAGAKNCSACVAGRSHGRLPRAAAWVWRFLPRKRQENF